MIDHGQIWQDRGEKGWRRVVASPEPLEILDAPAVAALLDAGFVVVAAGGGGVPVVRDADGALEASRRSSTRTSTAALLGAPVGADVLVIATDVPAAIAATSAPPRPSRSGTVTRRRDAGVRRRGPLRERLHGSEGGRGLPVRRGRRAAGGHHRRWTASSTAAAGHDAGTVVVPNKGEETPCLMPSRYARCRSTHVADASGLAEAHRRRRDGGGPGDRGHRQDRGQRGRQRLHPDHRRPGLPRGAGREGCARRRGQAGSDRLVRRHRRRDQPARDDLRHHGRRTRRPTSSG